MFSDHFAGVGQSNVSAGIDWSPCRSHKQYLPPTESTNIFWAPASFAESQKIIKNIKSGNSVEHDELSTNLLKSIARVIFEPLIQILNLSINSGIFPSRWKIAQIIRLHKQGDKFDVSNYCPIAILSPLSKVFKKILKERISSYLDKINFFTKYQFGFKANCSTEHAVAALLLEINDCLDNDSHVATVFCDIKKSI